MARMTGVVALAFAGAAFLCGNAQKGAVGPLVTYLLVLEGLRSISYLLSKDLGGKWRTLRLRCLTPYTQALVKVPISRRFVT